MCKVTIIGSGNVAWHLCVALSDKADELISVNPRTLEDLPTDSDIYLLAVKDDAIEAVAASVVKALPENFTAILAHTSGSKPMNLLEKYAQNYGVFYPLQTFTKGSDLDYNAIPVFIESNRQEAAEMLRRLAATAFGKVYDADSSTRRTLHIASVFACNYVNYLWSVADRILEKAGLGLDVLYPLIDATAKKITHMSPLQAQTGPASRHDLTTIEAHMKALADSPEAALYKLLAEAIMKKPENT